MCLAKGRLGRGGKEGEELGFLNDPELKSSPPSLTSPREGRRPLVQHFFSYKPPRWLGLLHLRRKAGGEEFRSLFSSRFRRPGKHGV